MTRGGDDGADDCGRMAEWGDCDREDGVWREWILALKDHGRNWTLKGREWRTSRPFSSAGVAPL